MPIGSSAVPTSEGLAQVRWRDRPDVLRHVLEKNLQGLPSGATAHVRTQRGLGFMSPTAEIVLRDASGKSMMDEDHIFGQGSAALTLKKELLRPSWHVEADALYLKPEYQRQGLGSEVFRRVHQAAKDLRATHVQLQADEAGKAVWSRVPGMEFQPQAARTVARDYAAWQRTNGGPVLAPGAGPSEYPREFLQQWSPGPAGFIGYRLKAAAAPPPGLSREKHRALQRVDAHFSAEKPDWDAFVQNARRKSFMRAVLADPRADATLRRHVEQMHQLHAGKRVKTVPGASGEKYQVVKKPQGGLACTCPDWRYRRSVMFGADQKCKHIHAYEASQEKSAGLTAAGAALGGLVGAAREYTKQRPERDAYRVHGDLGHVAPDVLEARARGRLGRVMLAGAGGAALGGLAGHGLQRAVPAVQGAARAAAHDIGHHLGRGVVEGARADLGASPPSGWLWRKMLQGIAPAEKAAGVGDNIAAMRALSAVTSPKTVAKSVSKTMGRLGTLTQKAPGGAVPPSGGT